MADLSHRVATVERTTAETRVEVAVNLDGEDAVEIATGVGFLDHMLHQLARHGGFGLRVRADGDLHIDAHHTVEDVGIVLGQAWRQALGDCRGIARYGHACIPMDEALVLCALDISGRGFSACDLELRTERIGSFDTELVPEFLRAFAHHGGITLHVRSMAGWNSHHIVEAAFKALAVALRTACSRSGGHNAIPSTKGAI